MIVSEHEQGTEEWFAARRGILTASNFGKLVTPKGKPSSSALEYLAQKVAEMRLEPDAYELDRFEGNKHTDHGNAVEDEARIAYEFMSGNDVAQVGFCRSEAGPWGSSPDGLIGEEGVLEIKCPLAKKHLKWKWEGKIPDEHKAQVHGEMLVTGADWADFFSYCRGFEPFLVRVTPDEFTENLREALKEFGPLLELMKRELL